MVLYGLTESLKIVSLTIYFNICNFCDLSNFDIKETIQENKKKHSLKIERIIIII